MLEMQDLKEEDANKDNLIMQDKKNAFIKMSFTPNRDGDFKLNMYDPIIWKGFPFSDRFWYYFCCKTSCYSDLKYNQHPIEDLLSSTCQIDNRIDLTNKCINLKIMKTGTLEIEPKIVHPFVRVSVVNLKTCKYLQKKDFDIPAFLLNEKNLVITHNKTQNILEYRESNLDFLPPFSTPPYDLREKGESFAEWNEEFILNEDAANIFETHNIIFFEIMDFNLISPLKSNGSEQDCVFPIAWGYLKPVGLSRTYFGKYKIQLYKYKHTQTPKMKEMKKTGNTYLRTPDVLFEFNWIKKEKYQTYLEIEIKLESRPNINELSINILQKKYKGSVFLPETHGEYDKDLMLSQLQNKKKLKYDELDNNAHYKRKALLLRRKSPSEDCYLPDRLIFKFNTSKLGCLTHEFSPDGKYLAAACTDITSITTIKIFNVEDGVLKYHFKGHQQIIHNLTWSEDSLILISSSSDNHVSFWHLPKEESNNIENLDYMDNEKVFKMFTLPHPSYVYSTTLFPGTSQDMMILATACFDGIVRIFLINFIYDGNNYKYKFKKQTIIKQINIFEEFTSIDFSKSKKNFASKVDKKDAEQVSLLERTVLDHRHPNSLVFDETGKLYIGDSLGSIHVWELRINNGKPIINKIKIITHKELEGDNINKIMLEPTGRKRLIIHSRDNCIRLVDAFGDKPKVIVRYFGLKCNKTNTKSTVSPDGNYILSGSEEGKPYLWSLHAGINLPTEKYECQFIDALADVSWNKTYNMFALSGFGHEYPLLVYIYEKEQIILDPLDLKLKNEEALLHKNDDEKPNRFLTANQDNVSNFVKEYKTVIEPHIQD